MKRVVLGGAVGAAFVLCWMGAGIQPSALADGLCRLMADPALAARLGDAARDAVRTRYSFNRMVDAFERVYLTELARRCGGVEVEPPRRVA